ncbi:MFS transporter [Streptomyces sp. Go-475]|uniref:MFS transporter n=1 Tax=Streptomyces sp. Go-475 TaxID=2072505 RepID=UPI000DF0BF5A|nr:MFS transporter [Streptomyces sp. Go-475]AXE85488.1 enterobactin exporter EntS [Streptomyces sp. Go-475]
MTGVDWRFRSLVVAHAVSAYGTYLNLIALSLFSYEVTGTAWGVGVVMAVRLLAGVTAGLAAGALSGRVTRRTVMVVTDLAQTLAMVLLALWSSGTPLVVLLGAVVVLGAGNTFFNVALRSAVPVMVGQDSRARANGVLVTARSVATVLGFASAAPVIALGGFGIAFAVNAASFAVSGAAVLVLRPRTDSAGEDDAPTTTGKDDPPTGQGHPPTTTGKDDPPTGQGHPPTTTGKDDPPTGQGHPPTTTGKDDPPTGQGHPPTGEGVPSARERSGPVAVRGGRLRRRVAGIAGPLLGLIALRGLDALASASHNVALPLAAHAAEPSEPAVFMTRFWSAWAVGTLLAHQVLKRRSRGTSWGERAFAAGTCAMSFCFVAAFTGLPAPALTAAAVAAGFADGWTEIVYTSRLQAAPDRQRGRLFGLSATAEQSGFALGTVAAAAALEALPALAVVGAFHGTAACGAVVLLLLTVRRQHARKAEDRSSTSKETGEDRHGTSTGASHLHGS